MGRVLPAFTQFFDSEGDPLSDGWVKFLESSSNNTLKNTYYDYRYQIVNPNPLRLSADGRCPDVFGQGSYRIILFKNDPDDETTPGEQVEVRDPVTAQTEGIGGGGGEGFQDWDSATTYQLGDIVVYNNEYYRSLIASNLNNNPGLDTFAWEKVEFIETWNNTISYNDGDLVRYQENLFFSKVGLNLNNQPDESPVQWRRIDTEIVGATVLTGDYNVLYSDRDFYLILGGTASADTTFTLPIVNASQSQFRVWFCNSSDFDLTIEPQGTANLWFDSTNDITITKGSTLEIRYCANQDRWMPQNNNGTPLGGQNIGTITLPALDVFATNIFLTGNASLGDDQYLYFGDSNDGSISYNSAGTSLDISSIGNLNLASTTGIYFYVNGSNRFEVTSAGHFLPSSPGISNIGSFSNSVNHLHAAEITAYQDIYSRGTLNAIGISNNAIMQMSGSAPSDLYIRCDGGDMHLIANYASSTLYLGTDSTDRWEVRPAGHLFPHVTGTYDIGSGSYYVRNAYIEDVYSPNITAPASTLTVSSSSNINLRTSLTNRWTITSGGTFQPALDSTYDIGATGVRPANIYANNIVSFGGGFSSLDVSGYIDANLLTTGTQTHLFITIDGNQSRISTPVETGGTVLYIDVLFNGTTYRFVGNSVP